MIPSIQNALGIGVPKTQTLSEREIRSSLELDPSSRNPLIARFGKNIQQDSLVLKALNQLSGSDNLHTRAQAYTSLSELGQRIANFEKGTQEAIQQYNKDQFSHTVDKHGSIDFTAIRNMTPFELHFFLNIFTNFENRGNVLAIQTELRKQCEELKTRDPDLAKAIDVALQADSSWMITYLKDLGDETAKLASNSRQKSNDLLESSAPTQHEVLLDEPEIELDGQEILQSNTLALHNPSFNPLSDLAEVVPNQMVTLSSEVSTERVQDDVKAPLLQKESKAGKSTSFFSRLLNLFRRDAQDSYAGVESKSIDKPSIWTRINLWWVALTAISTDDEPLGRR